VGRATAPLPAAHPFRNDTLDTRCSSLSAKTYLARIKAAAASLSSAIGHPSVLLPPAVFSLLVKGKPQLINYVQLPMQVVGNCEGVASGRAERSDRDTRVESKRGKPQR
jgi:hypothetical protein